MNAFRVLLSVMIVGIFLYTGIVGVRHGWNLFPAFFGDIAAMNWPGQFNFDFSCFLILSGLWLAWRHDFSPSGIALGIVGVVGGIMFLAPYLLFTTISANGEMTELLLGKKRANGRSSEWSSSEVGHP